VKRFCTVNEDFAIESMAGTFPARQRIVENSQVNSGVVRVEDAHGQHRIPFWLGEAPARTRELSVAVWNCGSRWREEN
jgi:ATP-dependent Lhr-like helicase